MNIGKGRFVKIRERDFIMDIFIESFLNLQFYNEHNKRNFLKFVILELFTI